MKWIFLLATPLLVILMSFSGCKTLPGTVTVRGTVYAPYWTNVSPGNPIVTVSGGGQSFTAIVALSGALGSEEFTYSIKYVPTGTYSLTIVIPTASGGGGGPTTCLVNGVSQPVDSEGPVTTPSGFAYDIEIDDVSLSADAVVDLYLASLG